MDIIEKLRRSEECPRLIPHVDTDKSFVTIKHGWQEARKDARLSDRRIHDLRHYEASLMISAVIYLFVSGKVSGHSDCKSTTLCSHLADGTLPLAVGAGASKPSAQWAS